MSDKVVLFIMSTGHSGSTLLEMILGSHTRIFGLGELFKLGQMVDRPFRNFPRLCSICESECEFWNRQASFSVLQRYFSHKNKLASLLRYISHYHKNIYLYFFEWFDYEILVDSSKKASWIRHQLSPAYRWREVSPKLLYLTRDGRAVVNSMLRKYPDRNVAQVASKWKRRVEDMNDFHRAFPFDKKFVAYEELATRPSEIVQSLCEFLQVEYQPEMLHYWQHTHHSCNGNLGTRSLIYKYRAQFEENLEMVWDRYAEEFQDRHNDYYDKVGLAIKLDLRWKNELAERQLEIFETVAGETNRSFAYPG